MKEVRAFQMMRWTRTVSRRYSAYVGFGGYGWVMLARVTLAGPYGRLRASRRPASDAISKDDKTIQRS